MLTYLKIHGFKSFHRFEMEFTPFTVITGAHGSGKSNLFEALHLLKRLAEVDLMTAFSQQRGHRRELFTQYGDNTYASEMEFTVEMLVNNKVKDECEDEATLEYTRLRYHLKIKREVDTDGFESLYIVSEVLENISPDNDSWVKKYIPEATLNRWIPDAKKKKIVTYIRSEDGSDTVIVQQGRKQVIPRKRASKSILSLKYIDKIAFKHILAVKKEMLGWKFMQFNLEDLRLPTKYLNVTDTITESGKNLAAVVFRVKQDDQYALTEISRDLNNLLPNLVEVDVYDDKVKQEFVIRLKSDNGREFSLETASEGTLRLLALLVLQHDSQHTGSLFFENPENGIDPSLVEKLGEMLREVSVDFKDTEAPLRQVIVNTHSQMLVSNEDENISLQDFRITSLITTVKDERIKLKVTTCAAIPPFCSPQKKTS